MNEYDTVTETGDPMVAIIAEDDEDIAGLPPERVTRIGLPPERRSTSEKTSSGLRLRHWSRYSGSTANFESHQRHL